MKIDPSQFQNQVLHNHPSEKPINQEINTLLECDIGTITPVEQRSFLEQTKKVMGAIQGVAARLLSLPHKLLTTAIDQSNMTDFLGHIVDVISQVDSRMIQIKKWLRATRERLSTKKVQHAESVFTALDTITNLKHILSKGDAIEGLSDGPLNAEAPSRLPPNTVLFSKIKPLIASSMEIEIEGGDISVTCPISFETCHTHEKMAILTTLNDALSLQEHPASFPDKVYLLHPQTAARILDTTRKNPFTNAPVDHCLSVILDPLKPVDKKPDIQGVYKDVSHHINEVLKAIHDTLIPEAEEVSRLLAAILLETPSQSSPLFSSPETPFLPPSLMPSISQSKPKEAIEKTASKEIKDNQFSSKKKRENTKEKIEKLAAKVTTLKPMFSSIEKEVQTLRKQDRLNITQQYISNIIDQVPRMAENPILLSIQSEIEYLKKQLEHIEGIIHFFRFKLLHIIGDIHTIPYSKQQIRALIESTLGQWEQELHATSIQREIALDKLRYPHKVPSIDN